MLNADQPAAVAAFIEVMFAHLREGHPEGALALASKVATPCAEGRNAGVFAIFQSLKAESLRQLGFPQEALETLTTTLSSTWSFSANQQQRLTLQTSDVLQELGKPAEAVDLLVPALQSDIPIQSLHAATIYRMHADAGRLLVQLRRDTKAVPLLQKRIALLSSWEDWLPRDAPVQAYQLLGEAQAGAGDSPAAVASFATALANLERLCDAGELPQEGGALQARIDFLSAEAGDAFPVGDDVKHSVVDR